MILDNQVVRSTLEHVRGRAHPIVEDVVVPRLPYLPGDRGRAEFPPPMPQPPNGEVVEDGATISMLHCLIYVMHLSHVWSL